MVLLKIFSISESEEPPLSVLHAGEHVLGRGSLPNCIDRRISRRHAIIKVEDKKATLTSVHVNPCFYIPQTTSAVQILRKDLPVGLSDDDRFAFVSDYWYRIKIISDDSESKSVNNSSSTIPISVQDSSVTVIASDSTQQSPLKRNLEELTSEGRKKLKTINQNTGDESKKQEEGKSADKSEQIYVNNSLSDSDDSDVEMPSEVTKDSAVVHTVTKKPSSDEEQKSDSDQEGNTKEPGNSDDPDDINEQPPITKPSNSSIKKEEAQTNKEGSVGDSNHDDEDNVTKQEEGATSSSTSAASMGNKIRREQCWYGGSCYRKNPSHKSEYSHPGDSDYDDDGADPNDDRPDCPYGAQCYRKNQEHRKEYKHSKGPPAAQPATRGRRRNNAAPRNVNNSSSESEVEDNDEDEPFSADESSLEDNSEDDGETSSNFGESQESYNMENSEDMKVLFKEAKKFLKK